MILRPVLSIPYESRGRPRLTGGSQRADNRVVTPRVDEELTAVRPQGGRDGEADVTGQRPRPSRIRLRTAAALAIVALAIVAVAGFEIYLRTGGDRPEPADAVVVLGPGLNGERLDRAQELLDEGLADTLVVSMARGGQRDETDAVCAGEPTYFEVVCFTGDPFSTRGEARSVAQLAAARGWRKLLVVTSDYHVRRARLLFSRCYDGQLLVIGAPPGSGPAVVLTDGHEAAGLVYATTVARGC